jgi:hypothetical protein
MPKNPVSCPGCPGCPGSGTKGVRPRAAGQIQGLPGKLTTPTTASLWMPVIAGQGIGGDLAVPPDIGTAGPTGTPFRLLGQPGHLGRNTTSLGESRQFLCPGPAATRPKSGHQTGAGLSGPPGPGPMAAGARAVQDPVQVMGVVAGKSAMTGSRTADPRPLHQRVLRSASSLAVDPAYGCRRQPTGPNRPVTSSRCPARPAPQMSGWLPALVGHVAVVDACARPSGGRGRWSIQVSEASA